MTSLLESNAPIRPDEDGNERFIELVNELADDFDTPEALNEAVHALMTPEQWRDRSLAAGYHDCVVALRWVTYQKQNDVLLPPLPDARPSGSLGSQVRGKTRVSEYKLVQNLAEANTEQEILGALLSLPKDALVHIDEVGDVHLRDVTITQFEKLISEHRAIIKGHEATVRNYEVCIRHCEKYHVNTLGELEEALLDQS